MDAHRVGRGITWFAALTVLLAIGSVYWLDLFFFQRILPQDRVFYGFVYHSLSAVCAFAIVFAGRSISRHGRAAVVEVAWRS